MPGQNAMLASPDAAIYNATVRACRACCLRARLRSPLVWGAAASQAEGIFSTEL